MAKISVDGAEIMDQAFDRMGRDMIRKIVEAGAGAAEKRMAENVQKRQHVRTGDMLKSIGNNGYREWLGGGATEVYPQEEDRFGVRNATKAFVINYGKGRRPATRRGKRNRTGDHFITGDESQAEEAVRKAMQAESDRLVAELDKE